MNGRKWNKWTDEERAALRLAYPDTRAAALREQFRRSSRAIYHQAHELGLRKSPTYMAGPHPNRFNRDCGAATQFKGGRRPWNKGQSYHAGGRSPLTRFKPGQQPESWCHIGTERISGDGYLRRKLTDTGYQHGDWVRVHVLLWQQHHGPIPPGHVVIFIDNDKRNIVIGNLALVTRGELLYLNRYGYNTLPPELRRSAIALARLEALRSQREKNR